MKRMGIGGVQTFDISFRRSISPNPGTSTYAKAMSRPHMPPPLRIPMMLRTAGTLACSAQGRTAERVMIHADSRAINLVDQKMVYVGISRAKVSAAVYTDDRAKLVSGIMQRAGEKQVAIGTGATTTHRLTKHTGASLG